MQDLVEFRKPSWPSPCAALAHQRGAPFFNTSLCGGRVRRLAAGCVLGKNMYTLMSVTMLVQAPSSIGSFELRLAGFGVCHP